MDAFELMQAAGGEMVRGIIRVRQEGKRVVLAKLNGDSMELTKDGAAMVRELETLPAKKASRQKAGLRSPVAIEKIADQLLSDVDG